MSTPDDPGATGYVPSATDVLDTGIRITVTHGDDRDEAGFVYVNPLLDISHVASGVKTISVPLQDSVIVLPGTEDEYAPHPGVYLSGLKLSENLPPLAGLEGVVRPLKVFGRRADGSGVNEEQTGPQAEQGEPVYAEVRLTTDEQVQRRKDLDDLLDQDEADAQKSWWKRLVSR